MNSSSSNIQLPRRKLGSTSLEVSILGLGTVKLGRNRGVKYPSNFELPDDKAAANILATTKDAGINLIDTAPAYGTSEERLGKLLKGQRQDWIICSKAGEEFDNETGDSNYCFTEQHIRQSIERTLKRLNTDYIDIALVHSDGNDVAIIESGALDTLNSLKQGGLVRATGMSTKTIEGGILAAQHSDCVMVTYNIDHKEEEPVLDFCLKETKGVLLKKILGSGHIAQNKTDALNESMRFIFSHPAVTSAIIGTINPTHIIQNTAAAKAAIR